MLTRKGAELRENLADRLDLPAEAAGLLKLTVMGRGRALIEQHRGLAGYTHERIEVLGGRTRLIINGEALELAASSGVEMPVCRFVRHLVKTLEQANAGALERAP